MKYTNNLNLGKPEMNDGIRATLQQLGLNFDILDSLTNLYLSSTPLSGFYEYKKTFYNSEPNIGEYLGWINIRAGNSAPLWSPKKYYNIGDQVIDSNDNTHYYTCQIAGTSAPTEPDFKLSAGSLTKDLKNVDTWSRNFYYEVDQIVLPLQENGCYYICKTEGNAGNSEPTWKTTDGEEVLDGTLIWITRRIVSWKESGISAKFRPFGKIE